MNTKILLADDEQYITHIMARKLRLQGYEVGIAQDGEEALRLATETPPDLVITDLQMPYMSGLELATRLRAMDSTAAVPVIMLTARGYVLSEEQLDRTNIREIIAKPFSARDVMQHVEGLLGTGAQGREAA